MSEIKNRLCQFVDSKGISRRAFCREINVPPNFLSLKNDFASEILINIYNSYPEISLNWLITGEGEMFSTEERQSVSVATNSSLIDTNRFLSETVRNLSETIRNLSGKGAVEDAGCAGAEKSGLAG